MKLLTKKVALHVSWAMGIITLLVACNIQGNSDDTLDESVNVGVSRVMVGGRSKKVLLVGIDGLQYEKATPTIAPTLNKLNVRKGYTGGFQRNTQYQGNDTNEDTSSGSGWTTVLTGVWVDEHGVNGNSDKQSEAPSLFRYIHDQYPHAYIVSLAKWERINDFYFQKDMSYVDYYNRCRKYEKNDKTKGCEAEQDNAGLNFTNVTAKAVEQITNKAPDFIFVHLGIPDGVGHDHGFGNRYNNAIRKADDQLGILIEAVKDREKNNPTEDWLIVVTTDHGREPRVGKGHGHQTKSEKTIFIGLNKTWDAKYAVKSNPIRAYPTNNGEYTYLGFDGLYAGVSQTAVAAIVLKHLGIDIRDTILPPSPPTVKTENNTYTGGSTRDILYGSNVEIIPEEGYVYDVSRWGSNWEDILANKDSNPITIKMTTNNYAAAWVTRKEIRSTSSYTGKHAKKGESAKSDPTVIVFTPQ